MRGLRELVGGAVMKHTVGPLCLVLVLLFVVPMPARADQPAPTSGELRVLTTGGPVEQCPLKHRAAVDDMEIKVGDRTIKGLIKKREEARAVYEAARQAGHIAALLDQERPNIFTQSVANILPGSEVVVSIRYFE